MGELVPEIRFEGFADPWEQRKLGDCGKTYGGLSGKTKEDFGHGAGRFVPYTNVFDNPITDSLRLDFVEIDQRQNEVLPGDVFFTVSSETPEEVGMSSVWLSDQRNVYLNSFCFGYRQNGTFDPFYLAFMLRSGAVRSDLTLLAQGISRFNISKNKVMDIKVPAPCMAEQVAIGRCFSALDELITLHQRKLDRLKVFKKSMLEKMFPKPGCNVPEIRFEGFTDPWEQRKLEDFATRHDNLRIPITAKDRVPGSTPYYGANGIQDYVEGYTHKGEFVLVAEDGATDIDNYPVRLISGFSWINNHAHVIQAIPKRANNRFLMHAIQSMDIASFLVGGTRAKLNAEVMMGLELRAPSAKEQERVGAYLSNLDNLITLHQRKLDMLKSLKKSMLQKMFV